MLICTDNLTCCHTETEAADQTFYLTQSQYTEPGRPVPELTYNARRLAGVATRVPILKSLV